MALVTVTGWMTEAEQYALRRWSFQKDVLEIGSFEGLSSVNISATCKSLMCVDTFDCRATCEREGGTFEKFWENIEASGNKEKVSVRRGTSQAVIPTLDEKYDLVFIDGDHSYEAVKEDIKLALSVLREDGLLLFHDYGVENLGVVKAIDEIRAKGAFALAQEETLVLISPIRPVVTIKKVVVYTCMPHRNGECNLAAARCLDFSSKDANLERIVTDHGSSVLPATFNHLFCEALNQRKTDGVTHFAMLHNDVVPGPYWLDTLMEELDAHKLDMISCVIPLKNSKGLTSTGIDTIGDPWSVRRLTMSEVYDLPETFTGFDIPYRETMAPLLLNTGCWLMKLDEPWVEGLHFRQTDRIAFSDRIGQYVKQSMSEDWDFSRQLVTRGARIGATRKVPIWHERPEFHNKSVWGEWTTDEAYEQYLKEIND